MPDPILHFKAYYIVTCGCAQIKDERHVNVQICASVKGVRYIYKYVHKGHDWFPK